MIAAFAGSPASAVTLIAASGVSGALLTADRGESILLSVAEPGANIVLFHPLVISQQQPPPAATPGGTVWIVRGGSAITGPLIQESGYLLTPTFTVGSHSGPAIPEPGAALVFAAGLIAARALTRRRG